MTLSHQQFADWLIFGIFFRIMDVKAGPKQEIVQQPIFCDCRESRFWIGVNDHCPVIFVGDVVVIKLSGFLNAAECCPKLNGSKPHKPSLFQGHDTTLKDLRLEKSTQWMPKTMIATNKKKKHPAQVHDPGFMKAGPHDSWIQQRKNHESLCIPCELCTLNLSPSRDSRT